MLAVHTHGEERELKDLQTEPSTLPRRHAGISMTVQSVDPV